MPGSKKTDYLQKVADKRFNGDIEKARAFFRSAGQKGGNTGVKYFTNHEKTKTNKK